MKDYVKLGKEWIPTSYIKNRCRFIMKILEKFCYHANLRIFTEDVLKYAIDNLMVTLICDELIVCTDNSGKHFDSAYSVFNAMFLELNNKRLKQLKFEFGI